MSILGYKIKKINDKRAGLVVEMIDRKTEKVVWWGRAKAPLTDQNTELKVVDYVDIIFNKFPVTAKENE